jgi:hypothetical protein
MQRAVEHLPPPRLIPEEKDVPKDMLEGAQMSQEKVIERFGERRKNPAYRSGWEDGRFGPTRLFVENSNLAEWAGHQERLAYYRGHREGRRVREMQEHGDSA